MAFRPCIDLRGGRVVQIVGGSLVDSALEERVGELDSRGVVTNFEADEPASTFADIYRRDRLLGGHVIALGPGNEEAARSALAAYPGGMQFGGGVNPDNAATFLDAGPSHVIVTSYLFPDGRLSYERAQEMLDRVGRRRLVIDLSCRRLPGGSYRVAKNRWQTVTDTELDGALFGSLEAFCSEFLIHAADVEGKCEGIDEDLVRRLGLWVDLPTTYAGGARRLEDISRVEDLSGGKVDLTIGSALDIFGGSGVRYVDAAQRGRKAV